MIYDIPAVWRIIATILLLMGLRTACQALCAPPRDKKEKQNFTILRAVTPFERFCTGIGVSRGVDPKDVGTITKEGYYPSFVLAITAAIVLMPIWGGTVETALFSAVHGFSFYIGTAALFKKPLLRLGRKYMIKHHVMYR